MIQFIFLVTGVMLLFLVIAIAVRNYTIGAVSSMGLMVIGVTVLKDGFASINNDFSIGLGVIIFCVGAYFLTVGGIEKIGEAYG